jgi:hypothetical protein
MSEYESSLGYLLGDLGLGLPVRFDPLTGVRDDFRWVGMHPRLVAVYSCALAHRIARANTLTPVTDDPDLFELSGDWTVDDLGSALLADTKPPRRSGDVAALYAHVALHAVVPAGLEHVPVEKIIRARRKLADEFHAFRTHVDALGAELAQLDRVEDPGILRSRLDSMVDRDLAKPVRELQHGLKALGLEPMRAVFGLKSLELPAVAALAANAMGVSVLAGASAMITVQLLASARTVRRNAREQRRSAAGYLLGLRRELDC